MTDDKKIELRSGEVQEILGGVPSRIVRYGILMFVAIFSLIIIFSFIFYYPDILRSNIVVTTENPPATLVARATGKIDKLFVEDKDHVAAGQTIALIENPADYTDVLELEQMIDKVQPAFDTLNFTVSYRFNKSLQLGAVQEYYSQFLTRYEELNEFYQRNYYMLKEESYKEQLKNARILYDRLWEQKVAIDKEYQIKQRNYERQKKLLAGEVVSSTVLEQAESEMLSKKSELDGIRSTLAERQISISELDQKIIENEKEYHDYKIQYESALIEAFNNLKSQASDWFLTYVLRSPIDGVVTFNKFYAENQNITEGDRVLTIVPEDVGEVIGKVELPVRGSGKVKEGLDVNVKFDNYPYMEYGLVRGKVKSVSLVPEDSFYMVEIDFPNGLVTNYDNTLQMQSQLMGQAEIITEDLRLIQRIFNPLKSLWKERVNQ
ncbi:HlyD family efflux transporter periplasmic adaptor subunit [Draconibacterium sp. IB214405]|uniref:HlyD family secretion protein n=1 Tax=Draconibacterium sp. IB214405 TaxID=3097352 RepID=UPI002A0DB42A|nr:HlyD family efflux transporter periplasmic adaptor subunit [Draconibacterium sp. IB214405]MDX8340762.1 HlyD family efflux transporter periplasmic adaptor subunit [Draconibacterium sp. IB214405]